MSFSVLGTRARLLSGAAAAMIALGACSSAATPIPATPPPATPAPSTAAPASSAPASVAPASSAPATEAASASPETYTIAVATGKGAVGKFLTGDNGMTLYTFKKDTPGDGKSACSGACADNWPLFTLENGEKAVGGAGVTGTIGTIPNGDSKTQVTYNGAPLYYFKGDSAAGDTNGQALNSVWFVAAP